MEGESLACNECNALVVEGGAMRGIFSTGVLDAFIERKFNPFQICIGVSAGATNIAPYLSQMYKRNFRVYTDYSLRPDFISLRKFVRGGHMVDLDWLWDITIKEIKIDLDKVFDKEKKYFVGVTEVKTGRAVYLEPDKSNLEEIIKASSCIPVLYRNFVQIDGTDYVDGGLADPIPVIEAYRRGAKNIMVIRSRPYSYTMKSNLNSVISRMYLKKYPGIIEAIKNRARIYEEAVEFIRKPPKGINILEVNPPETFQTKRLTKDISKLEKDYRSGHDIGMTVCEMWNRKQYNI